MPNGRQTGQSVVFVSKKQENLVLPKRKLNKTDAGYSNLARNIPIFYSLKAMPLGLDQARLDDGDGIEETL